MNRLRKERGKMMDTKSKKSRKKLIIIASIVAVAIAISATVIGLIASGTITNWIAMHEAEKIMKQLLHKNQT